MIKKLFLVVVHIVDNEEEAEKVRKELRRVNHERTSNR